MVLARILDFFVIVFIFVVFYEVDNGYQVSI